MQEFTHPSKKNGLMAEELSATYLASALITCVIGTQFAARESVGSNTRLIVEVLFVVIALLICVWTFVSYFNLIPYEMHRLGLVIIFLAIMAAFVYLIVLAFKHKV